MHGCVHTVVLHVNFLHKSVLAVFLFSVHVHIYTSIKMLFHLRWYKYRMAPVCSIIQKSECSPSDKNCLSISENKTTALGTC